MAEVREHQQLKIQSYHSAFSYSFVQREKVVALSYRIFRSFYFFF